MSILKVYKAGNEFTGLRDERSFTQGDLPRPDHTSSCAFYELGNGTPRKKVVFLFVLFLETES